jgi:hypothetical protein
VGSGPRITPCCSETAGLRLGEAYSDFMTARGACAVSFAATSDVLAAAPAAVQTVVVQGETSTSR